MKREYFIESASRINLPEKRFVDEYSRKKTELIGHVNKTLLNRKDLEKLIGQGNSEMMLNNHNNHALFIEAIMLAFNPNVLVDTVLWVFKVYKAHGFTDLYWTAQLNAWLEAMRLHLSEEAFRAIEPLYNWMIVNLPILLRFQEEHQDA